MTVNLLSLTGGQLIAKASPIDYWLDGLVVRNGDVNRVRLAGAAGDVIVENGDLNRLTANADNKLEPDGYDGIIGSVYAENINRVEIGSGLMHEGESHLARAGIFADHFINRITGKGVGNDIEGLVIAAGTQFSGAATADDVIARLAAVSINRVYLTGGASLMGAEISGGGLNDWFMNPSDIWGGMFTGDINRVRISGGGMIFGSMFVARNINQIDSTQGAWDTSIAHARNDITRIRAAEFRNSLVNGRLDESPHNPLDTVSRFDPYLPEGAGADYNTVINSNYILATGNVDSILTSKNGNITDLVIEIAGDLTNLKAYDIVRTEVGVSTTLMRVDAKGRILASEFTAGDINRIRAGEAIRTTSIEAAGPIDRVEVRQGEIYNTFIRSDGTDGQIGRIVARTRIENATIESAGPIRLVQAKTGDVNVSLTTFKAGEAHLYNVTAGRDIRGSYNVDGDIVLMRAGENLGTDPALLPADADTEIIIATHNLHEIDASGGQIYTEIRVQGAQTGTVKIGDVVTRNGTAMSASTATYVFAGSVNHFDSRGAFNATIESRSGGIGTLAFRGAVGAAASLVAMDGGINRVAMTGTFAGTVYADDDIQSFSVNGTVNGGSVTSDQDIRQATFTGAVNSFILMAGNTITSFNARSSLTNTTIGAGERIAKAYVGGLATDVNFVAGLESLGADGALGGGDDTVTSGDIDTLTLAGGATRVNALAGWDVGLDGAVDPDPDALVDDSVAPGLSVIDTVTASGAVLNSFIRADTSAPTVPGFNGQTTFSPPVPIPTSDAISAAAVRTYVFAVNDPDSGAPGVLTLTITYAGPGFVEPTIIDNTGNGFSADDRLSRLDIYGSDDHSNLTVNGVLRVAGVEDRTGFAHLASDAGGLTITAAEDRSFGDLLFDGNLVNTDSVAFDGNVDSFTVSTINTTGTLVFAELLDDFTAATFTSGTLTTRELGSAEITSGFAGMMNAEAAGSVLIAGVWTGIVSVTDDITSVTAAAFQGTVRAGGDIQRFNATSAYRGIVSAGDNLGPARVTGNTDDSFFLAGFDVGPNGAFGGGDDALSNGNVHSVNVGGNFTRSDVVAGIQRGADGFHGTSDDVYAPGLSNIGRVTIGGTGTGSNIGSESYAVLATGTVAPVTVAGYETLGSGNFVVKNVDTDVTPVQVAELRTVLDGDSYTTYVTFNQDVDTSTLSSSITISSTAATPNTLVEGTDYFLTYDDATRTVAIAFEPHVGQSTDPPDQGPGVDERPPGVYLITIEADPAAGGLTSRTAGGTLDGDGDGFANGDATEPDYERGVIVGDAGDRLSQITITLDDNNTPIDPTDDLFATLYGATDVTSTGIIPINEVTLLSGIIGNHPDETPLFFSERLDVDAYAITVEAGDVVRIRTVFAEGDFYVTLRDASDYNVDVVRAGDGEAGGRSLATGSLEDGYVFQRPGTYYLTVVARAVADPAYVFGSPYPNWPPSMISHGILPYGGILADPGIADVGDYTLEILHFRDGDTGFLDTASNPIGTLLDTAAGPVTVNSSIGFAGFTGRPDEIINDADVFLLNNGNPLPPGSIVDVSLLLSELGADIESIATGQNTSPLRDTPGVELAVFDVTNASHFTDAQLIAAPTINAVGDRLTGDADFSYSVTLPGDPDTTPGTPGASRIYAIMVQGNQRSDYSLSVEVTSGDGLTPTRGSQNVLLELGGGTLDWLEVFGTTELDGFDLNVVGFAGQESTVIATVMTRLNAIFASVDVTFATSSAAFENQDFTTVFLSSSFAPPAFGDNIEYAFNNGIDVRNSNTNQEVAVFMPKFAPLGLGLGEEEELSNAIANVVAKELAKTFGLREIDAIAADASNPSMTNIPYPFAQDDSIMTENLPGAWTGTLAFYVDPMIPMAALQLDPGEFLMGSATALGMLDAALDD
ncbi:MAG: hypothetical protein KAS72_14860 [Phycisphaerales bacterium]|nr:hypothetical protein [Phycisphaerales bacterium]